VFSFIRSTELKQRLLFYFVGIIKEEGNGCGDY